MDVAEPLKRGRVYHSSCGGIRFDERVDGIAKLVLILHDTLPKIV
jgi:hypothetical protein